MRKPFFLMMLSFCAADLLAANLVLNNGFEAGAANWTPWWVGPNIGLPVTDPVEGDRAAAIWWNDDGISQNLGWLAAGNYKFSGKILASGGLANQRVVIQAEMGDGTSTQWTSRLEVSPGQAEGVWHARSVNVVLSQSQYVKINLLLAVDGSSPHGVGYFDDISFGPVAPQQPRTYYGAKYEPVDTVMHAAGQNVPDFNAYWNIMDTGEKPACYMTYCNLSYPFVPALRADLERYHRDYGVYMPVQLGLYIVDSEFEIAAGLWDADIQRFCDDLKQLGYPLYIRIGYECNGAHNHYDPTAYKTAFIRITNALRANNVPAATVFNVIQGTPWLPWYPGNEYVDWMSINAFGYWNVQHSDTYSFLADAHARGKPVLIGEADPTAWQTDQGEASWTGDFVPYFNLIKAYPGIKNFCHINTDWSSSDLPEWGDCRLQPYPIVYGHYRDEMSNPLYMHGTNEAALRQAITGITDSVPPGPITNITVDTFSAPVALSWTAASDNTGIDRYEILRDGRLAGYNTETHFIDMNVTAGKTYTYQVTAIDQGATRGPASSPVMVVTAPSIERLINNEYDQGRAPWKLSYSAAGVGAAVSLDTASKLSGPNSVKLNITSATGTNWHLQYQYNLDTKAGYTYRLTYTAVADRATAMTVALQETHSPYSSFIVHNPALTTTPQTFTVTGVAPDNDNVNLSFMLGSAAPRIIWLDAVSLTEIAPAWDPQTCQDVQSGGFAMALDLSNDCYIDIDDLLIFAGYWLDADCLAQTNCGGADTQPDGRVTLPDLAALGGDWLTCNNPQDPACSPTW
ncbi:MAG: fibronectin type III domain-containing protein [Planctomycetaceae bacterium]|nr:fibronectin type III domain-containing protein [Planctomycetaceae bacterium]